MDIASVWSRVRLSRRAALRMGVPMLPPGRVSAATMRLRGALGRAVLAMAPPQVQVVETALAAIDTHVVGALVELGVPAALAGGPLSSAALATAVEGDIDACERILRHAWSRGFVARRRDGRWAENRFMRALRADGPFVTAGGAFGVWPTFMGSAWSSAAWARLAHSARTGEAGFEVAHGAPFFEWVQRVEPAAGATFDAAMAAGGGLQGVVLAAADDWSSVRSVCDVGGGTGAALAEILTAHPRLHGALLDLPEVVARVIPDPVWADRMQLVGGDFFAEVPSGHDRYLLTAVLHDWNDDACVDILSTIGRAAAPGAEIVVVESIVPERGHNAFASATDVMMLVLTGSGRERTAAQLEALARRAGLRANGWRLLPSGFGRLSFSAQRRRPA